MILSPRRVLWSLPYVILFVSTAGAAPPAAPVMNSMSWASNNNLDASWQDKSNDESGFILAYRTAPETDYNPLATYNPNTTSINNLQPPADLRTCGLILDWIVVSYKDSIAGREYGFPATTIRLMPPPTSGTCPPAFWVNDFTSGDVGSPVSVQASPFKRNNTNGSLIAVTSTVTATGLPAGLSISNTGLISGTPTASGKFIVTLSTQETGGQLGTGTTNITIFRPVPAPVPPENTAPLADRTLRRNAAATQIDLGTHFNDPDVTDASRLVFNTGTIDFVYFPSAAPATVANFKGYISRGDFVNTIIHRSVPGFVLQGGGYKAQAGTPSITRQPPVVNEPGISNTRGTVAMAKSADNPDSATSEYFISLGDNSSNLNNQNEGFSVFARVPAAGMAQADYIASLCTFNFSSTNGVLSNCPVSTFGPCPTPKPATPVFDPAALVKLVSAGPVAPLSYAAQSSAAAVCGASVNGAQLSLTPLAAGTAVINVTATDLDNQGITSTLNVVVEEHLEDWLTAHSFPNPGDATAAADPDADSGTNIMEFALMTDPQSPDPVPVPAAGIADVGSEKYLTLTFPVRKLAGSGFSYSVERSDNLNGPWTTVWSSPDGFTHAQIVNATDQADRTTVTVRDTDAISTGSRKFVRLRVTETP